MVTFLGTVRETKMNSDKKVLLCERKRHTARRAASVRCADLSLLGGGGGYLPLLGRYLPWPGGGIPTLSRGRGTYPG